jgi:hypothetical protein
MQQAAGGSDNAGEEGRGEVEDVVMAEVVNSSDGDSNSDESSAKCTRKLIQRRRTRTKQHNTKQ